MRRRSQSAQDIKKSEKFRKLINIPCIELLLAIQYDQILIIGIERGSFLASLLPLVTRWRRTTLKYQGILSLKMSCVQTDNPQRGESRPRRQPVRTAPAPAEKRL